MAENRSTLVQFLSLLHAVSSWALLFYKILICAAHPGPRKGARQVGSLWSIPTDPVLVLVLSCGLALPWTQCRAGKGPNLIASSPLFPKERATMRRWMSSLSGLFSAR